MVLYYSHDGVNVTQFHHFNNRYCYDIPAEIGHLYTVHLTTPTGQSGQMIITSDLYRRYHLYSHTHQQNNLMSEYSQKPFFFESSSIRQCPAEEKMSCTNESHWMPVTIATVNVWNINSTEGEDASRRLVRLGQTLAHLSLDLIGLQEVRTVVKKGKTISQMWTLHKALPNYQFVYQPAMLMQYWPREEEGVALFSRFPILSSNPIMLPWNRSDPSDFHQRVCLHCQVAVPYSGTLNVFLSHLSLSEEARINSIRVIVDYIRYSSIKGPIVLMGDLNGEDTSPAIRYLREELNILSPPVFVDVWLTSNSNRGNGNTFSTLDRKLTKRIDYIFVQQSGSLCINSTYLIGSKSGKAPISDHLGVAARLMKKKTT